MPGADHRRFDDTQREPVGAGPESDGFELDQARTEDRSLSVGLGPILYDPELYFLASQLDAVEALRIASQNRHRMATRGIADSDGVTRGLGLADNDPAVKASAALLHGLEEIEHQLVLGLNRCMRAQPLGPWQKSVRGIGAKQLARLLACIGDPYWQAAEDRPRTVSQLWAYCGLHVLPVRGQCSSDGQILIAANGAAHRAGGDSSQKAPDNHVEAAGIAARRAKGQKANWSTDAKTKAYLIAESCLKAGSYRDVYDDHKARAAATVHAADCAPCKAKAGTPLALGHQHARAMRAMSKAILKDLWIEARRLHAEAGAR